MRLRQLCILFLSWLLLCCLPFSASAAITYKQNYQQSTNNGYPAFSSALTLATGENCIVLFVAMQTGTATNTVSDNNSGVWTEVTGFPVQDATLGIGIDIWISINHPSGSTTLSVQPSTGFDNDEVLTFSGVATSSAVDGHNSVDNQSSSGTLDSGLVTLSSSNDVVVSAVVASSGIYLSGTLANYGSGGGTPTGNYSYGGGSLGAIAQAYQILSSGSGTFGGSWGPGNSGNSPNLGGVVALKPAAAAAGLTGYFIPGD